MLSQKLRDLRKRCNYKQWQVAEVLNISRSTYSYYELGKSSPDLATIGKLAKLFNVSYEELLDDESEGARVHDSQNGRDSYYEKRKPSLAALEQDEITLVMYYRLMKESDQKKLLTQAGNMIGKKTEIEGKAK